MAEINKAGFDFSGKVALITGAGRGIDRTLADGLAKAGADVIFIISSFIKKNSIIAENFMSYLNFNLR